MLTGKFKTMKHDNSSNILTAPELRRFQHQINLKVVGLKGQERIKAANVIVVGAGGMGAQVLQFLAASGVGNITIVDDELVSENTIQVQTLYGGNDLGKLKTIISRQQLQNLYPLTTYNILNLRINAENAERFLSGCDFIVDATNNPGSNYIINDACIKLKKQWVYGHTSGFSGEVTVFNNNNGPSFRCLYPDASLHEKKEAAPALVYGTLGCIMATECIKLILGSEDILSGKVLNFDLFSNVFLQQTLTRVDANFNI